MDAPKMSDEEKAILEITGQMPREKPRPINPLYEPKMGIIEFLLFAIIGIGFTEFYVIYIYSIYPSFAVLLNYMILIVCIVSLAMALRGQKVSVFTYLLLLTIPTFADFFLGLPGIAIPLSEFSAPFGVVGTFLAYFILSRNHIFG